MFGNPQWFRPKAIGWGLVPVSFKGWLYTGGWIGAIAVPFLLLISRGQPMEAFTWMTLGIGALAYDVRQILRSFRQPDSTTTTAAVAVPPKREDNVLYIMDSAPGIPVATQNYNLRVRR
jgi:hypothetical protein